MRISKLQYIRVCDYVCQRYPRLSASEQQKKIDVVVYGLDEDINREEIITALSDCLFCSLDISDSPQIHKLTSGGVSEVIDSLHGIIEHSIYTKKPIWIL